MGANVNAADVAKKMSGFARDIQRERMGRETLPPGAQQADPQQFQALLNQVSPNGQEQDAAPVTGALQKERSEEGGWQRNVGQGEEESGFGQGSQVQGTKEEQQGRRMR